MPSCPDATSVYPSAPQDKSDGGLSNTSRRIATGRLAAANHTVITLSCPAIATTLWAAGFDFAAGGMEDAPAVAPAADDVAAASVALFFVTEAAAGDVLAGL